MSLKDIDMTAVLRRLAERRIEDAMQEGKFDNLEGMGKPLDLDPLPADENARMMWWTLRIMKSNDFLPDEVRYRKSIETLKSKLRTLKDESALAPLVTQINHLVRKLNTMGTNALTPNIAPLDLDHERTRLRQRLGLSS